MRECFMEGNDGNINEMKIFGEKSLNMRSEFSYVRTFSDALGRYTARERK